jgi:hypothetical protein
VPKTARDPKTRVVDRFDCDCCFCGCYDAAAGGGCMSIDPRTIASGELAESEVGL